MLRKIHLVYFTHSYPLLQSFLPFSGKLSSAQIKAGYAALKDIETYIKENNFGAPFVEANNTYYTRSNIFIR